METVEERILTFLSKKMAPIPVYMMRPEEPDSEYCIMEVNTGQEVNRVVGASVTVRSVAPTLYRAATLSYQVIAAMRDLVDVNNVTSCALNSNVNYTDTTTKEYRYQTLFTIHYMLDF